MTEPRSSACRDRMHGVCRGYTDGYETYRCECACHEVTATLTATGGADTSGQRRTPVPVTWFYRAPVRACPSPPRTTDQKAVL